MFGITYRGAGWLEGARVPFMHSYGSLRLWTTEDHAKEFLGTWAGSFVRPLQCKVEPRRVCVKLLEACVEVYSGRRKCYGGELIVIDHTRPRFRHLKLKMQWPSHHIVPPPEPLYSISDDGLEGLL